MTQQPLETTYTGLYDAQGNPVTAWYDEHGQLHHDTIVAGPDAAGATAAPESLGAIPGRGGKILRRTIGLSIVTLFAFALYWIIFQTTLLTPLLAYAQPVQNGINWVIEDPKRAWAAAAVMVIPHIGLYFMIFEDR